MSDRELDKRVALIMGLVEGVDFGQWPRHDWERDEDGKIDRLAYDAPEYHSGPLCRRCGFGYCTGCEPQMDPEKPETIAEPCQVAPPAYSEYIQHAWDVLVRFGLLIVPVRGGFLAGQLDGYLDPDSGIIDGRLEIDCRDAFAVDESAPRAICLAALKVAEARSKLPPT